MQGCQVFFVSDGTGLTAEMLGHSLLSQFEQFDFKCQTFPYIDSIEKAQDVIANIAAQTAQSPHRPLIFSTLITPSIRSHFKQLDCCFMDLFAMFLQPLETELQSRSSNTIGRSHGVVNVDTYNKRIEAINFALMCDDGLGSDHYAAADVIVIGASRSGKTPCCLYLALQFGILAANYPITSDDEWNGQLPKILRPHQQKLFGLTIAPDRLHAIREERRPNSTYAALTTCTDEIRHIERLFSEEHIKFINTSQLSIEEIATRILVATGIARRVN